MSLITYPLNDIDYDADGAALFHCTRTSGLYAGDDFAYSVDGTDNTITLQPGLAWMNVSKFKGQVCAMKTETYVDMGLPDANFPRIDRVVLQFSANKNSTDIVVKKGSPASNPYPPERSTTEALYELHLLEVRRQPGAVSITNADITDLRLDPNNCGLMSESVSNIDTTAIEAQFRALLQIYEDALAEAQGGTAYELKRLQFIDTVVEPDAFLVDDTYADFPLRAAVPLTGVLESMTPEVVLDVAEAMSGEYAPVAETYTGGVYIYASSKPQAAITIPTIICWKAVS